MSVDTYLRGKNLAQYQVTHVDGLKVLVSPELTREAKGIALDTGRFLLWRRLTIGLEMRREHVHNAHCQHSASRRG